MDLKDLQHKKKTVGDLIRFIKNTTSDEKVSPNFSIFLGAGASVTSDIRSGQTLVNTWKDECVKMENEKGLSSEDFFSPGNAPEWFDPSNAYSSLFEHRYDLQRQRRIFVEHEVAGKTPSLGYAYLVKIIDNGYFNTIFTTNFDDLLNEAFHQFSNNRPIVCAHDSSIAGVSVTSDRPKIIKLHGDYLFDNIKTTLRETESLETNMRLKFQEFAKDYGLIVVGYSGQDRSIMDILTFLLQQEDYFKNGIYWCIRKGDEENVCGELKKLLWKDRAFYVEIDGFDELMCELNRYLNDGELPVDDKFLSHQHQVTIISKLTDNPFIKNCQSAYLQADCKKLNDRLSYNHAADMVKYIRENRRRELSDSIKKSSGVKPNLTPLTKEQHIQVEEISDDAFLYSNKNKARQRLSEIKIDDIPDSMYKLELLELYADLNTEMSDSEIQKVFEELIRLNPRQQRYYEIASGRSTSFNQKKDYLYRAVQAFPNDFYILNSYVGFVLDEYEDRIDKGVLHDDLYKIKEMINKSLSLNKSISNEARLLKVSCAKYLYQNERDKLTHEYTELEKEVQNISMYHPNTLKVLRDTGSASYTQELLLKAVDFYSNADNPNLLEECYILLLDWYIDKASSEDVFKTMRTYEASYEPSVKYKGMKFQVLVRYEHFAEALSLYNELRPNEKLSIKKLEILNMLGRTEEMDSYYNSIKQSKEVQTVYLSCKGDWQALNQLYSEWVKSGDLVSSNQIISYSYSLLQAKDYEGVERLLKPYYDKPELTNAVIIINFLFARKQKGKDVAQKIKEKVIDNQFVNPTEYELIGAYGVLKEKAKTLENIKKLLKKNPVDKYNIREWPILEFLKDDQKFIELTKPATIEGSTSIL